MSWAEDSERPRVDWRGWLGVAWVVVWGIAYVAMVIRVKGG